MDLSYSSLAEVYDRYTRNVDYRRRSKFIDGILKKNSVKGTVLDAGCGTGTLALLLRKLGYEMVCVDLSSEMLSEARDKLVGKGFHDVTLLQQDLRELDLYGTVAATVSMLDVINHLESIEDVKKVFSRISLFSEPGAPFIFDINLPYKHKDILASNSFVYTGGGYQCVWHNEYHESPDRVEMEIEIYKIRLFGKEYLGSDTVVEYSYSLEDIIEALKAAGFIFAEAVDGESYKPLSSRSQRALVTAYKE